MAEDLIKHDKVPYEDSKYKKLVEDLSNSDNVDNKLKTEKSIVEKSKKDKSKINEKSKGKSKWISTPSSSNILIKIESTDKRSIKSNSSKSNVSNSITEKRRGSIKARRLSSVGASSRDKSTKCFPRDSSKMLELNISDHENGRLPSSLSKTNSSLSQNSVNGVRYHHHQQHHHREKSSSLDPTKPIRPDKLMYRKKSESSNKKLNEIKKFPDSLGPPLHEGFLNSKNTFIDGRRSNNREWKHTYAVLRGHCLCLHPDQNSQTVVIYDTAISIRCAFVDIAYDYSKKRHNVFRLTTFKFSEFLFEASTAEIMLKWIDMIQAHGHTSTQGRLCKKILEVTGVKRPSKSLEPKLDKGEKPSKMEVVNLKMNELTLNAGVCPKSNQLPIIEDKNGRRRSRSETRMKDERRNTSVVAKRITHESAIKLRSWRDRVVDRLKRGQIVSLFEQQPSVMLDVQNTFAIDLDKCVQSTLYPNVPLFVEYCTRLIEENGITKRGIYRIPGNAGTVAILESLVNQDPWTFNENHAKWNDINAIISLLKLFFRKLPQPLITTDLYPKFIEANHCENKTKRLLRIKRLIHMLPVCNFETLLVLARHLNKVASYEEENMMDSRNLAIIFGPTLMQIQQETMVQGMVKDMSDQCHIIENIINYYSWFFGSWDEDVLVPDSESLNPTPVTSMDQSLLEKAEHHFLEGQVTKKLAKSHISKSSARKDKPGSGGSSAVYSLESVYSDKVIDPTRGLRRDLLRTDGQTSGLLSVNAYGTSFRKCSSPVIGSPRLSPTYARSNSDFSDMSRRSSYSGYEIRSRRTSKINVAPDVAKNMTKAYNIGKNVARTVSKRGHSIRKHSIDLENDDSKNDEPLISLFHQDNQIITDLDLQPIDKIVTNEILNIDKKIFPLIDIRINDNVINKEDVLTNADVEDSLVATNNHQFDEKSINSIGNEFVIKSKDSTIENRRDKDTQSDTIESQIISQIPIFVSRTEDMNKQSVFKECLSSIDDAIQESKTNIFIKKDDYEINETKDICVQIENIDFRNKTAQNVGTCSHFIEFKSSKSLDFLDSKYFCNESSKINRRKDLVKGINSFVLSKKIVSSVPSSP